MCTVVNVAIGTLMGMCASRVRSSLISESYVFTVYRMYVHVYLADVTVWSGVLLIRCCVTANVQ